jgi:hypothetical protein
MFDHGTERLSRVTKSLVNFSRVNRHLLFPLRRGSKYLPLFQSFLSAVGSLPPEKAREAAQKLAAAVVDAVRPIEWSTNLSALFWLLDPKRRSAPIVRARCFPSRVTDGADDQWVRDVRAVLRRPEKLMAAPSPETASAGRCHFASKPVFYGSFQEDTCIAELRPLVGACIIFASFESMRELRVFRICFLRELVDAGISDYQTLLTQINERKKYDVFSFIYHLDLWLGHPLTTSYESTPYLARRTLCDALRRVIQFDGLEFSSSQISGDNLVIFPSDEEHRTFPLRYVKDSAEEYWLTEAPLFAEKFPRKNMLGLRNLT